MAIPSPAWRAQFYANRDDASPSRTAIIAEPTEEMALDKAQSFMGNRYMRVDIQRTIVGPGVPVGEVRWLD